MLAIFYRGIHGKKVYSGVNSYVDVLFDGDVFKTCRHYNDIACSTYDPNEETSKDLFIYFVEEVKDE